MKNTLSILVAAFFSTQAHAMISPQYVSLDNAVQFGKFLESNMSFVVESSSELAKKAIPNSHYFLITKSITLNTYGDEVDQGVKPIATIHLSSSLMDCSRDVFTKVTANQWGEQRKHEFTLSGSIRCDSKP